MLTALSSALTLPTGKISHENRAAAGTELTEVLPFPWVIQSTHPFLTLVSLNAFPFNRFNGKLHNSYINNTFKQSQTCHICCSLKTNSFPIVIVSRRQTSDLLLGSLRKKKINNPSEHQGCSVTWSEAARKIPWNEPFPDSELKLVCPRKLTTHQKLILDL